MKITLRFQCTEYDCGTTSFINALLYLYDREDIPIEFIKEIYKYTLDVEDKEGIIGKGGTSRNHAERLARFFVRYANTNEKINIKQISAIIVAFIGALFIIKPSFDVRVVPYVVGFLSAVFAALAYTCVRMLGNKEEYYTIVFFFSTFSLLAVLPVFIIVYKPMSLIQLMYLILAGVFASLGQFGVTLAYKYAPAKEISIFDYSNIIFSAILSIFMFGVYPDGLSVVGYFIIFAAALYMFFYNKKQDKLAK